MNDWISVKDRLPNKTTYYLVWIQHNSERDLDESGCYCEHFDIKTKWADILHDAYQITHWMPLPEPPMNEGEGK